MLRLENVQRDHQNVKSSNPLKKSISLPICTLQILIAIVGDSPTSMLFG